jgi:hypothetical protein
LEHKNQDLLITDSTVLLRFVASQPGEGGLAHPQATYISPKLFLLLACLKLLMDAIDKCRLSFGLNIIISWQ